VLFLAYPSVGLQQGGVSKQAGGSYRKPFPVRLQTGRLNQDPGSGCAHLRDAGAKRGACIVPTLFVAPLLHTGVSAVLGVFDFRWHRTPAGSKVQGAPVF